VMMTSSLEATYRPSLLVGVAQLATRTRDGALDRRLGHAELARDPAVAQSRLVKLEGSGG